MAPAVPNGDSQHITSVLLVWPGACWETPDMYSQRDESQV